MIKKMYETTVAVVSGPRLVVPVGRQSARRAHEGDLHAAPVQVRLHDDYSFEERGDVEVKGKGSIHTWFLEGRKLNAD